MKRLLFFILLNIFAFSQDFSLENTDFYHRNNLLHLQSLKYDIKESKLNLQSSSFWHRITPNIRFYSRLSSSDFTTSDSDLLYILPGKSLSLSMSWNINKIFYSHSRKKSHLSLLNSINSYNSYLNTVSSDTSRFSKNLKLIRSRISFLKNELDANKKLHSIAKDNYNSGSIDYKKFIKSKQKVLRTKKELNSLLLQKNRLISKYKKYSEFLDQNDYIDISDINR